MNALQRMPRLIETLKALSPKTRATAESNAAAIIEPLLSHILLCLEMMGAAGESTGANTVIAMRPSTHATTGSRPATSGLSTPSL